ncbi:hypothetical protein ACFSSA_10800 [Luteolibacter algae]|uniref:Uncharacterized protein n=1 Tax=Luteolibacter algae TaxID=454151 RepID=A0ABW5D7X8_9BACT
MIKSEKFFELEKLGVCLKTVSYVPSGVELAANGWDEVLDELSENLCKHGLTPDDEPNRLGILLEDLIDLVNSELESIGSN